MAGRSKLRKFIAATLMVVLFCFFAWLLSPRPIESVTPSGYVARLEAYNFSTNRVEYRLPKSIFDHKLIRSLPISIQQRIPRRSQLRAFTQPIFPGEPILSCAFTVHAPANAETPSPLRVVTSDEHGNEFDPVAQDTGIARVNPVRWVKEVRVFPRRGRLLNLKIKRNAHTLAHFQIPNPARGDYPQWTPSPLPISAKSGNLEVRLVDLTTEVPAEDGEKFPATLCTFEIFENGAITTNWLPMDVEIADATGNHWRTFRSYSEKMRIENGRMQLQLMGALWPGEEAWKIPIRFRKQSGFSDNELLRFRNLRVPLGDEIVRANLVHEANGGRLELIALLGPNVTPDQARSVDARIVPRPGHTTIVLQGKFLEEQGPFAFLDLYDENEKEIPFSVILGPPVAKGTAAEGELIIRYALPFEVSPGTKEILLVCAPRRTEKFEFIAKPR